MNSSGQSIARLRKSNFFTPYYGTRCVMSSVSEERSYASTSAGAAGRGRNCREGAFMSLTLYARNEALADGFAWTGPESGDVFRRVGSFLPQSPRA